MPLISPQASAISTARVRLCAASQAGNTAPDIGPHKMKALHQIAAGARKKILLALLLHTFSDNP